MGHAAALAAFWTVCLSLGLTLLRETVPANWTRQPYLVQVELRPAMPQSALFLAGNLDDSWRYCSAAVWAPAAAPAIIFGGIVLCGLAAACWARPTGASRPRAAIALLVAVGFLLIGPYSYMAGSRFWTSAASARQLRRPAESSTASGISSAAWWRAARSQGSLIRWDGRVFLMLASVAGPRRCRRVVPGRSAPLTGGRA